MSTLSRHLRHARQLLRNAGGSPW